MPKGCEHLHNTNFFFFLSDWYTFPLKVILLNQIHYKHVFAGKGINLPTLVSGQILKLKQLTVLTLAKENKVICFTTFMFVHVHLSFLVMISNMEGGDVAYLHYKFCIKEKIF